MSIVAPPAEPLNGMEDAQSVQNVQPVVYHATVRDIPVDDRPRERLQKNGPETLTTADLLAIILRTGTVRDNAMELATKLLLKYGGLGGLVSASFHELSLEYGLGMAKTAQLKASLELGKRLSVLQPDKKFQVHTADDAASLVRMEMMYLDHEEMHVLILDTKNQVVERVRCYKGTVNSSVLRTAEVFRPAVVRNCPRVIVCHNHPSGDPSPSPEDINVTRQLVKAGQALDIELLDHLVIGNPRYMSLKERLQWE
ncbi:MAG TPA: DNA repair protein RadC [Ktedonobacteraceae bacterium]|jgi:DNA repair protein RadC|nr:DNA repair protein RadC [Ktedonobacteraceae bacterium]